MIKSEKPKEEGTGRMGRTGVAAGAQGSVRACVVKCAPHGQGSGRGAVL